MWLYHHLSTQLEESGCDVSRDPKREAENSQIWPKAKVSAFISGQAAYEAALGPPRCVTGQVRVALGPPCRVTRFRQHWARPALVPSSGSVGPAPPWSLSSEFRQWPVLGCPLVFLGLHDVFKVFESELKIKSNSFFQVYLLCAKEPW